MGLLLGSLIILEVQVEPLSVPLEEPFVIASGAMVATRSVLVRALVVPYGSRMKKGLGEAAALPPVTACDQPELLAEAAAANAALHGERFEGVSELAAALADRVPNPVLRAGIEAAVLDACGTCQHTPVYELLTRDAPCLHFDTDITIPIGKPDHMADLARKHRACGFSMFKIKVGRDLDDDIAALQAIASAAPDARLRVDANGGYDLAGARAFLRATRTLDIECFEQPCARGREDDMATLAHETHIPLVADESLRSAADLKTVIETRCASAVNLKLVKLGGLVVATEVGRAAQAAGLDLMVGAMVETRLGLTAMMHVAAALGGARYVDLDTQLLLAREPFVGGYTARGPEMTLTEGRGFDIREAET